MSLNACSTVHFLYQAGKGQLRLLNRARPLSEVIADPTTDPKLADLLKQVPEIKAFGEKWGLKPTPNYGEYVKLDQDAVVYVVTVSEPLEFKAKVFSFPIVGSFTYIGWFSREDADDFAAQFSKKGKDVDVRGASAYSTLGWFKDPLLSTMIPSKDGIPLPEALPELVNIVIHESVHATIYINDQSYFNESLAFFLADLLTEKYFTEQKKLESSVWKTYREHERYYAKVQARMAQAYRDLKAVYDSSVSDDEKRTKKAEYLAKLQSELRFPRPITNATLIQFQTYDPSDHGFGELFDRCGKDVGRFLKTLKMIKTKDFSSPQQKNFETILPKHCEDV